MAAAVALAGLCRRLTGALRLSGARPGPAAAGPPGCAPRRGQRLLRLGGGLEGERGVLRAVA